MSFFSPDSPCRCGYNGQGVHQCHASRDPRYPGERCPNPGKEFLVAGLTCLAGVQMKLGASVACYCDPCKEEAGFSARKECDCPSDPLLDISMSPAGFTTSAGASSCSVQEHDQTTFPSSCDDSGQTIDDTTEDFEDLECEENGGTDCDGEGDSDGEGDDGENEGDVTVGSPCGPGTDDPTCGGTCGEGTDDEDCDETTDG